MTATPKPPFTRICFVMPSISLLISPTGILMGQSRVNKLHSFPEIRTVDKHFSTTQAACLVLWEWGVRRLQSETQGWWNTLFNTDYLSFNIYTETIAHLHLKYLQLIFLLLCFFNIFLPHRAFIGFRIWLGRWSHRRIVKMNRNLNDIR